MPGLHDQSGWVTAGLLVTVPTVVVTVGFVLVSVLALAARRPGTRRHSLDVLVLFTQFVGVLRGKR